jgi:UDP-N-acetylmuramoylalanine--D-glutamate ligase
MGVPAYGELEVASWFCPCPIVAVTGSNGKTTATTLIAALLSAAGMHAPACGNIGRALADVVDDLHATSVAVVEVSSFQLATIASFRPHVAIILNVSPDHLDWHGSMDAYRQAKHRIAGSQGAEDWLIVNADDEQIHAERIATAAGRLAFSVERDGTAAFVRGDSVYVDLGSGAVPVFAVSQLRLLGRHNLSNATAAALCARLFGVSPQAIAGAVQAFAGVEHRLEVVGRIAGVTYINDSKATNVDATCVALAAVEAPIHLILGGRHKGAPYGPIAQAAGGRLASVVAIGEAADLIAADLGAVVGVQRAPTLADAVHLCFRAAGPGDVVLLSPACSSFDMFSDFEARGRAFKDAVAHLAAQAAAVEP